MKFSKCKNSYWNKVWLNHLNSLTKPLRHWFFLKLSFRPQCDNKNYDIVVISAVVYMFPKSHFVFQWFIELADLFLSHRIHGCSIQICFLLRKFNHVFSVQCLTAIITWLEEYEKSLAQMREMILIFKNIRDYSK